MPNCAPLWFLTCMISAYLLFWILVQFKRLLFRAIGTIVYLIILLSICKIEKSCNISQLPWHIDVALIASVFMFFGYYLKKYIHFFDNHKLIKLKVSLAFFLAGSVIGMINGRVNMVTNDYQNLLLFCMSAILISTFIILVCRGVVSGSYLVLGRTGGGIIHVLSQIGKDTLYIMGLNYFFNGFIREFCEKVGLGDIMYTILDTILVIGLSCLFAYYWRLIRVKMIILVQ